MKRWVYLVFTILFFIGSVVFYFLTYQFPSEPKKIASILMVFISIPLMVSSISIVLVRNKERKIQNLQNRLESWTKLSYHVSKVGDELFNELPVGVMVFGEDDDEVKWANNFAINVFGNDVIGKKTYDISQDLTDVLKKGLPESVIPYGDEKYDILYNKELNSIYLFNATRREEVIEKYQNHIPALGLIYLDNLDEALASLDFSEQSSIKGEYLGIIADWVSEYDGHLKTFSDERLVMNLYRENLEKMIANNFTVLEKIREVSDLNNVKVSVSIGIASWDINYEELGAYAQNAVELAERRGGDQVVVNIQHQKIEYFGAKQDATATHSKVNTRVNAQTLKELVDSASNVFIMAHVNADTDAFGSCLAMLQMIRSHHPSKAQIIFDPDRVDATVSKISNILTSEEPDMWEYLSTTKEALKNINDQTLLIVLDTQSPAIVMSPEVYEKIDKVAVIDHHRSSGEGGFDPVFSYVEPYASSTIELLVELMAFYSRDILITPLEASMMYAGLIVDTNNFLNRTGVRTFEVASTLREYGADMTRVNLWLRKDRDRLLQINKLVNNIEVFLDRFAFSVAKDVVNDRVLLAQVSDEMLQINGIDAAFTIAKDEAGLVCVSARSIQNVNVQILMEEIGGGGHLTGAAAQIPDTTVKEVYQKIKQLLELEYGGDGEVMKIILTEDVKNKGKKDDIIDVAAGYGNYLIKNNKAVEATDENIAELDAKIEEKRKQEQQNLLVMQQLKKEIESKSVTIKIQVGHDGKMFGSVTTKQIVEAFEEQNQIALDRKKVRLVGDINSVGIYTAEVDLHKDVQAQFEVHVVEK